VCSFWHKKKETNQNCVLAGVMLGCLAVFVCSNYPKFLEGAQGLSFLVLYDPNGMNSLD